MKKLLLLLVVSLVFLGTAANAAIANVEYNFDETSGLVAADGVASNDATLSGFAGDDSQWVDGLVGNALSMGAGNNLVFPTSSTAGQKYSISFYMKAPDNASGITKLYGEYNAANGSNMEIGLYWGTIKFYQGSSGWGFAQEVLTGTVADNEWHHIVASNDFGQMSVYIDGVLSNSGSYDASATSYVTPDINYFSHPNAAYSYNGLVDGLTTYNGAVLTTGEIADLAAVVPEPATMALLGLGSLLLRRKKNI